MTSHAPPPDAPPADRLTIDVSELPTTTFGRRNLNWWGTIGFMAIEGTTMIVAAASLLYIRGNFDSWPPRPILPPDLGVPTVVLLLLLVKLVPAWYSIEAAQRLDRAASRRWMALALLLGIAATAFRLLEFESLNVRWDTNAYGSIAWATVGFHGTVLSLQVVETLIFTVFMHRDRIQEKHFGDASDSAFYWYFMVGSWVPLYVVVYLSPYFLP